VVRGGEQQAAEEPGGGGPAHDSHAEARQRAGQELLHRAYHAPLAALAAVASVEFDRAERRGEVQAEWEARGLVRREAFSSCCFGVGWDVQSGKWLGKLKVGGRPVYDVPAAVVARQRELGLEPGRWQASEFNGVVWLKRRRKWRAGIQIGGKNMHLGSFGAGHPGEVDAALASDAAVRALGSAGRSTNNTSERTNFEGLCGLSREQASDVEARLERHLRAALLAVGGTNGFGEEFEQQLPRQVRDASPARPRCPPAEHRPWTAWPAC
jgi:hypothetical protein